MPLEGRICPYCMKPILSTSMKYYVRKKDQEAWAPGSQLASRFKLEIQACRRENLYKQFWSERLAEGKMGWDLEDRLVVTEQMVRDFHERGLEVGVWTVNDAAELARVSALGVDYIESDVFGG